MEISQGASAAEGVAQAALAALGLPPIMAAGMAFGVGSVISSYLEARRQVAVDELLRQMKRGRPWKIAEDRTAAMILQFSRAYQEGVGRENLRLMAAFMFNEAAEPTLTEAETRRNLELLATLSPDEIRVCAGLVLVTRDIPPRTQRRVRDNIAEQSLRRAAYHRHVEVPLLGFSLAEPVVPFTLEAEIRRIEARERMEGIVAGLMRTGWVMQMPGNDPSPVYLPTPGFAPVARMAEFEASLGA